MSTDSNGADDRRASAFGIVGLRAASDYVRSP